jgi:hypothetical protein
VGRNWPPAAPTAGISMLYGIVSGIVPQLQLFLI